MATDAPMLPIGVVVPGFMGRMGALIATAALQDDRHVLSGVTLRPGDTRLGQDAAILLRASGVADVAACADLTEATKGISPASVIIDFTPPAQVEQNAKIAAQQNLALVVGTTSLDAAAEAALNAAAREIPVLVAANMSLGANLLVDLAKRAAAALPQADAEIVEIHHRKKRDAPSGTALRLGHAVAKTWRQDPQRSLHVERSGEALRTDAEIGVFGVRGGTVAGEHTVYFFLDGERIELTHRAADRNIFALGALAAARFLSGQPKGRYDMQDVLGLG